MFYSNPEGKVTNVLCNVCVMLRNERQIQFSITSMTDAHKKPWNFEEHSRHDTTRLTTLHVSHVSVRCAWNGMKEEKEKKKPTVCTRPVAMIVSLNCFGANALYVIVYLKMFPIFFFIVRFYWFFTQWLLINCSLWVLSGLVHSIWL